MRGDGDGILSARQVQAALEESMRRNRAQAARKPSAAAEGEGSDGDALLAAVAERRRAEEAAPSPAEAPSGGGTFFSPTPPLLVELSLQIGSIDRSSYRTAESLLSLHIWCYTKHEVHVSCFVPILFITACNVGGGPMLVLCGLSKLADSLHRIGEWTACLGLLNIAEAYFM